MASVPDAEGDVPQCFAPVEPYDAVCFTLISSLATMQRDTLTHCPGQDVVAYTVSPILLSRTPAPHIPTLVRDVDHPRPLPFCRRPAIPPEMVERHFGSFDERMDHVVHLDVRWCLR
jgi:hypothetical protein